MPTKRLLKRPLDLDEILGWARAYRQATGKWPTHTSGGIAASKFESWARVDEALRSGLRGLPGGSSLAQLLADRLGARNVKNLPPLTVEGILHWADQHQSQTGKWPTATSGAIANSSGENWQAIDTSLRVGVRKLSGGSSLAQLLAEHRGVRNRKQLPPYTEEGILGWADAHYQREGECPHRDSGPIVDAPGETWMAVDVALRNCQRGMPGGSSLAFLLAEKRGVRNVWSRPDLTADKILAWADEHFQREGSWPQVSSGAILGAKGETWTAINHALMRGSRGLSGSSSLADLLAQERGVPNPAKLPKLTRKLILGWADAYHRRSGKWPMRDSGSIQEAPEETWTMVCEALRHGWRGLRAGSSLARLLAQHRNRRHHLDQPPLSKRQILAWADAHHERTGKWPNVNSGEVHDAPGEKWALIDNALLIGHRGQPGGSSLRQLLAKKRGVRNPLRLPPLTVEQILEWAKSHLERTGKRPPYNFGPIADAPGETWAGVDWALRYGKRGLPAGSSLAKLLDKNGIA